jgi:hypothetical protein
MGVKDHTSALSAFGELLMHEVRDPARNTLQQVLRGEAKSKSLTPIASELVANAEALAPVEALGSRLIDEVLDRVLVLFEQHPDDLRLDGWGQDLTAASDGLAGELYGETGWIASCSAYDLGW